MLHSISHRYYERDNYLLCSFVLDGGDNDRRINLLKFSTTRAVMKVNCEAREVVLAGRNPHRITLEKMDVFMGGLYYNEDETAPPEYDPPLLQKSFFVNPELDMFYFRRGLHKNPALFLDESCLQEMRRIAIDIRDPISRDGMLYAPSYSRLFGENSQSHWVFARDNLPSLKTIVEMKKNIVKHYGEDDNVSEKFSVWGEPAIDELEDAYGYPDVPHENEKDLDEKKYDEDLEKLSSDKFGFHNVESKTCRCYFKPVIRLSKRESHPVQVSIAFRGWVREIISRAQREASEFLNRSIDIQMVMDHSGNSFVPVESYYRYSAGFFNVDLP
ncbi:hypothetical protein GQX73_g1929 [Xylaria multiplex]|uniref:Uncharacterized protein n=1 Tax=Xylaria multiplex TaxID=323545 RepID=A0A7C8MYW6_9PEZI|nr:hypothetical protein GQX73_g1929 [Xylaria multiplex]